MASKHLQRLMGELEQLRRGPQCPETENHARNLAIQIGTKIPKRILNKALKHPPEIRRRINPQDINRHPVLH